MADSCSESAGREFEVTEPLHKSKYKAEAPEQNSDEATDKLIYDQQPQAADNNDAEQRDPEDGRDTVSKWCSYSPSLPHKWSPMTLIFVLSFLGHWGDRKWMFTAGIILVKVLGP
ncbi:hypothetical protein FHG87_018371 [Trinorchestia longiramus]|nr:hypothetical protein FHG87_018371 [Trinorchestia longiramus]